MLNTDVTIKLELNWNKYIYSRCVIINNYTNKWTQCHCGILITFSLCHQISFLHVEAFWRFP